MFPRVKEVRHAGEYRLELSFTDGTTREVDLRGRIAGRGGVFVPLQDLEFFKRVRVDSEAGTIVWPNGVDLCPDVLYSLATGKPVRVPEPAGGNNCRQIAGYESKMHELAQNSRLSAWRCWKTCGEALAVADPLPKRSPRASHPSSPGWVA